MATRCPQTRFGCNFLAIAALSAVFAPASTRAATYSYSFTVGAGTTDVANKTVTIPVYLRETSSDSSSQINSDGGLFSFGLTAAIVSGPGQISSLVRSSAFDQLDGGTTTFPASAAKLWAEQNVNFPNGPTVGVSGNIPVATLTISGLTAPTLLTVGDYGSGSQTVDYNGTALDPDTITQFTASVPEPAQLVTIAASAAILLPRRRRGN